MENFKSIVDILNASPLPDGELLSLILKKHRRMVFTPSKEEISWMLAVSHVENFGVFGKSYFGSGPENPSFVDRILFTKNFLMPSGPRDLGFWPYLTLQKQAVPGANRLYKLLRKY